MKNCLFCDKLITSGLICYDCKRDARKPFNGWCFACGIRHEHSFLGFTARGLKYECERTKKTIEVLPNH